MLDSSAVRFECDNSAVESLLATIVSAAVENGGQVADQVIFREQAGELSVHRDPARLADYDPPKLLAITLPTLTPVAQGNWQLEGDQLTVQPRESASDLTALMLRLHADLYNMCGKPAWYLQNHPEAAFTDDHPALPLIRCLRPGFTLSRGPYGFLKTRILDHRGSGSSVEVLLPMLDSLNHHPSGGRFLYNTERMQVRELHPTGSTECLANYGGLPRDALDQALEHAFVDTDTNYANSAPLNLEVPTLGVLDIGLLRGKKVSVLNPPSVQRTAQGLRLSHMTFHADHADRTVVPLRMILASLGVADPETMALEAVQSAVDSNEDLLSALQATLHGQAPVEVLLRQAVERQLLVLQRFRTALDTLS